MLSRLLRKFLDSQIALCAVFDRLLPARFRVDGYKHFQSTFAPEYVRRCQLVYDVGGGKTPFIGLRRKQELSLRVVGLDVDQGELDRAPRGAYDEAVCADATSWHGRGDADLVVCQALLEHVRSTEAALATIHSILKSGGTAVLYIPSRNALYSRLNLWIPETIKLKILHAVYPEARGYIGFPAYYDRCTPRDFRQMAKRLGFEVLRVRTDFVSPYFRVFFPLYMIWRAWQLVFHWLVGEQAAETFSVALRKE